MTYKLLMVYKLLMAYKHFQMHVIAWLEFELAYYDFTIQHLSHYAMVIPPVNSIFKDII